MTVTTTSVALGSGYVSQTISWTPPAKSGGLVVDRYRVFACTTSFTELDQCLSAQFSRLRIVWMEYELALRQFDSFASSLLHFLFATE